MIDIDNFPIQPKRYPAESLIAYVGRLYSENGHKLNSNTQIDSDQFYAVDCLFFVFPRGFPRFVHKAKYCPGCLLEFGYRLAITDIPDVNTCPLHECFLIADCSFCKREIRFIDIARSRCRCKAELLGALCPADLGLEYDYLQILSTEWRMPREISPKLKEAIPLQIQAMSCSDIGWLIQYMRLLFQPLAKQPNSRNIHQILSKAFMNWPTGLYDALNELIGVLYPSQLELISMDLLFDSCELLRFLIEEEGVLATAIQGYLYKNTLLLPCKSKMLKHPFNFKKSKSELIGTQHIAKATGEDEQFVIEVIEMLCLPRKAKGRISHYIEKALGERLIAALTFSNGNLVF